MRSFARLGTKLPSIALERMRRHMAPLSAGVASAHRSVSGNWRVTFRFVGVDAEVVDYEDYH